MAKSNSRSDLLLQDFAERHQSDIAHYFPIIFIDGNKNKDKIWKEILIECSRVRKQPIHIFDNADDCSNFVMTQLWEDKNAKCFAIVSDQLANEIVPDIVHCEQIVEIIIIDNNLSTQQERESMKTYPKVCEQIKILEDMHIFMLFNLILGEVQH